MIEIIYPKYTIFYDWNNLSKIYNFYDWNNLSKIYKPYIVYKKVDKIGAGRWSEAKSQKQDGSLAWSELCGELSEPTVNDYIFIKIIENFIRVYSMLISLIFIILINPSIKQFLILIYYEWNNFSKIYNLLFNIF